MSADSVIGSKGFRITPASPSACHSCVVLGRHLRGEEDDRDVPRRRLRSECRDGRRPVHPGHHHIQQDDVRAFRLGLVLRLRPRMCGRHLQPPTISSAVRATSRNSSSSSTTSTRRRRPPPRCLPSSLDPPVAPWPNTTRTTTTWPRPCFGDVPKELMLRACGGSVADMEGLSGPQGSGAWRLRRIAVVAALVVALFAVLLLSPLPARRQASGQWDRADRRRAGRGDELRLPVPTYDRAAPAGLVLFRRRGPAGDAVQRAAADLRLRPRRAVRQRHRPAGLHAGRNRRHRDLPARPAPRHRPDPDAARRRRRSAGRCCSSRA